MNNSSSIDIEQDSLEDEKVAFAATEDERNNKRKVMPRRRQSNFDSIISMSIGDEDDEGYITLPESTHTLLHTQPMNSLPFAFSVGIALLSISCLVLVIWNALSAGEPGNKLGVPVRVETSVLIAQYCGLFVGLLAEEEIPQALILLRLITRESLQISYPEMSYTRFLLACVLRLVMGYLFLLNLFLTIVQADNVIGIFFDILALEFVQKLDDVSYGLSKKYMLGRRMLRAASKEYKVQKRRRTTRRREDVPTEGSSVNHEIQGCKLIRRKCGSQMYSKAGDFVVKSTLLLNLSCLLIGVSIIASRQLNGRFWCSSVQVRLGDDILRKALIRNNTDSSITERTLVYAYFNGHYVLNGTYQGRPRYTEQNKVYPTDRYNETIPAEIRYCNNRWVFYHPDIVKTEYDEEYDREECQWLLRSPKTKEFNLLDVAASDWEVWKGGRGAIGSTDGLSIACDDVDSRADCNYHGDVIDSTCECHEGYTSAHCEFEMPCKYLEEDFSVDGLDSSGIEYEWSRNEDDQLIWLYDRAVYNWIPRYDLGDYLSAVYNVSKEELKRAEGVSRQDVNFTVIGTYVGNRWVASLGFLNEKNQSIGYDVEYHAFWRNKFAERTFFISSPETIFGSIIGVDMYRIVDKADYNGSPYGVLDLEDRKEGAGFFRCYEVDEVLS
ncbi:hypothetical protein ACHAWC_010206 [Mediolabrus comicus]